MDKIDKNYKLNALTQILQVATTMIIAISAGVGFIVSSLNLNSLINQCILVILSISFLFCFLWAVGVYLQIDKYLKS